MRENSVRLDIYFYCSDIFFLKHIFNFLGCLVYFCYGIKHSEENVKIDESGKNEENDKNEEVEKNEESTASLKLGF